MAKTKDDIKYATAQAKHSEDEAVRVRYKADTPLEAGRIADSEPVDLFSSARNISDQKNPQGQQSHAADQSENHPPPAEKPVSPPPKH